MRALRPLRKRWLLAALLLASFSFASPSPAAAKPKTAKAAKPARGKKGKTPAAQKEEPEKNPIPAESRQLVLVAADDWNKSTGTLRRFARKPGGPWQPVGAKINVVLGKSGLAWGKGLHGAAPNPPVKREGDGRSPAGAFAFGTAFGSEEILPAGLKLPYQVITRDIECVDDGASSRYNTLADRSAIKNVDWHSSERMMRTDGRYSIGVVIEHNVENPVANAGSCTFLQIRVDPPAGGVPTGTAGGTALEESDLRALLGWLDPAEKPVFVLLPAPEHKRRRAAWGLPQ